MARERPTPDWNKLKQRWEVGVRQFLLNARAASTCARATHNRYDETIDAVEWAPPDELGALFERGINFEDQLLAQRLAELGDRARDLRALDPDGEAHVAATVAAMAAGIEVIVGGRLPNDFGAHRIGKPDLLIRSTDTIDGTPGYVPADIKAHTFTAAGKGSLVWSDWEAPAPEAAHTTSGQRATITKRQSDVLQLAHYWRMLEACARAAEREPIGAIVGTDKVDDSASPFVWVALDTPAVWTYSRTEGKKKRSPLERYDHEHAFRIQVAERALLRTGTNDDPIPLVRPIYADECEWCQWHDTCLPLMDGDPSVAVGRLDRRSWHALEKAGVTSLEELAALEPGCLEDPDCELSPRVSAVLAAYLPEVTHRSNPRADLAAASHRARMLQLDVRLERKTTGPVELPTADVHIDFDIEWDYHRRVYLWGFLVTEPGAESVYHPIAAWSPLDERSEAELAAQAWTWLSTQVADAHAAGRQISVWHYSHPEVSYWRRIIERDQHPDLPTVEVFNEFVDKHFVDLNRYTRLHLRALDGLGLKNVATRGPGFAWRDDDPGGLQSQAWHADSLQLDDPVVAEAAQTRVLEYNEDDVRATCAVREWLNASDG